jgi:hypothetical protein
MIARDLVLSSRIIEFKVKGHVAILSAVKVTEVHVLLRTGNITIRSGMRKDLLRLCRSGILFPELGAHNDRPLST